MNGRPPFGYLRLPGHVLDGALVVGITSHVATRRVTVRILTVGAAPFALGDEITVAASEIDYEAGA